MNIYNNSATVASDGVVEKCGERSIWGRPRPVLAGTWSGGTAHRGRGR